MLYIFWKKINNSAVVDIIKDLECLDHIPSCNGIVMLEDYEQLDALNNLNVKFFQKFDGPALYLFQVANITFLYGFQIVAAYSR